MPSKDPEDWSDGEGDESWRPEEPSEEGEGFEPSAESDSSGRTVFPAVTVELASGRLAFRGLVHSLCGAAIVATGGALLAVQRGSRGPAELLALVAIVVAGFAAPALGVARRLARYPRTGHLVFGRRGFRLPWLNREAPGPEGPWEAIKSFAVRKIKGGRMRVLILEVAAGRFALTDRSLGEKAFDAAVLALESALGPEGVLLGTLVRLPIHPTDRRTFLERKRPWLVSLAVVAAFVLLASQATLVAIRFASALGAAIATLVGSMAQQLDRMPGAELVLALDGLVVPLPEDLRRTVKLPFATLRRGAVEDQGGKVSLVIEHEKGRLLYPLEWFDAREAKEFARQLADRAG